MDIILLYSLVTKTQKCNLKIREKGFTTLFVDIIFSLQITRNFLDEGVLYPKQE